MRQDLVYSAAQHHTCLNCRIVKVCCKHGLLHEALSLKPVSQPTLALLSNAGLAAYPTWIPTIQQLCKHQVSDQLK